MGFVRETGPNLGSQGGVWAWEWGLCVRLGRILVPRVVALTDEHTLRGSDSPIRTWRGLMVLSVDFISWINEFYFQKHLCLPSFAKLYEAS